MSGCAGELSTLDPAGPAAADIARLWWVMLAGSVAICGLVTVLLVLAFRNTSARDEARLERTWIVGLGLGFSLATLAALLTYGLVSTARIEAIGDDAITVSATADRTGWTFGYADQPGRTTRGVLHIPAGRRVAVEIATTDVIHSFWVPRLAGKRDAIPGHVNTLVLTAGRPGTYRGQSAEYSGPAYAAHGFEVRAHDEAGWQAFLAEEGG